MPFVQVPVFMQTLRDQTSTAARALEFLILTASRSETVLGAQWREIDLSTKVWTVPGSRMKAGNEHRVPLPPATIHVLEGMAARRENEFVFPGTQTARMSRVAMLALLRSMGHTDVVVHGFRSAFRDWVSETTSFTSEVAELALAHTIRDKTEAPYRRGDQLDKRRRLMDSWAEFCTAAPVTGVVVPLRA